MSRHSGRGGGPADDGERGGGSGGGGGGGGIMSPGASRAVPAVFDELKELTRALNTREERWGGGGGGERGGGGGGGRAARRGVERVNHPPPLPLRKFLLSVESELTSFIADTSSPSKTFPPLNPYFRRLFHLTCRRFGIDSSSSAAQLWGLDKGTVLTKSSSSRTPVLLFADFVPSSPAPADKVYAVPSLPPVHSEALRARVREQAEREAKRRRATLAAERGGGGGVTGQPAVGVAVVVVVVVVA